MSTNESMGITDFLLARITEEEAVARVAQHIPEAAMNITRWHPARVLAECASKRHIVQYLGACEMGRDHIAADDAAYRAVWWVMSQMAKVYSEHPDYREEWKP